MSKPSWISQAFRGDAIFERRRMASDLKPKEETHVLALGLCGPIDQQPMQNPAPQEAKIAVD